MTQTFQRREFLHGLAGWAALSSVLPAIEPLTRNGQPKFKFSLAAYSYRSLLTGANPTLTLADFVRDCARFGLEGTELTSYYFPNPTTPEYLREIKRLCFQLGLDISGTAVGNDLCHPPGETRDQQIALVKRWVDYAEILGAPVIRVFSGNNRGTQTREEAHRLAVQGLEECCEYAGQHGVFLALENHGGLTATVDGMLALVRDVRSPWFGVNLDSGNFHGETLYDDLARIAPYALNVQIKVIVSRQPAQREPADFERLARILREANYRGYVVLEYEEREDPREACPRFLQQMRTVFREA